jgi:hypothetical protein
VTGPNQIAKLDDLLVRFQDEISSRQPVPAGAE